MRFKNTSSIAATALTAVKTHPLLQWLHFVQHQMHLEHTSSTAAQQ
jgi:hypothetical protein